MAIARLGRSVGLRGDMRFHLLSDFPEQFRKGATFESDRGPLTIERYDPKRGTIKFVGIDSPEAARRYTNAYLYSDEEQTREQIPLEEGEYFWFDIIGCHLYEGEECLGVVEDIQRLPSADYLVVRTSEELAQKLPKRFLVPYQDPFIEEVDLEQKRIQAQGARAILEAS
ncbi:MAG: 16S rRNA processing protein RimM [Nitratiruptor sp.]|nr:16S rRNA processing protein RimM [Nitratiruptor sp.]NPA83760.1 16S rRNA processing protein RimM [Campylobacterota bacterium]